MNMRYSSLPAYRKFGLLKIEIFVNVSMFLTRLGKACIFSLDFSQSPVHRQENASVLYLFDESALPRTHSVKLLSLSTIHSRRSNEFE